MSTQGTNVGNSQFMGQSSVFGREIPFELEREDAWKYGGRTVLEKPSNYLMPTAMWTTALGSIARTLRPIWCLF
jgi:hypothetical protein